TEPQNLNLRPNAPSDGETAARAFEMFDLGVPVDEIVVELAIPPDVAETLLRTWARLRQIVPLTPETLAALRIALAAPLTSTESLFAPPHAVFDPLRRVCRRCRTVCAEYCDACPAREARRAGKRKARSSARKSADQPYPIEDEPAPGPLSAELGAAIAKA